MTIIHLIDNRLAMRPETIHAASVHDGLRRRFPVWPHGARIYAGGPECVAAEHDVTPADAEGVAHLDTLDDVTVLIIPGDPASLVTALVNLAISVAASFALNYFFGGSGGGGPGNTRAGHANNALGQRTNEAAVPNQRIPDIYGQVRSYPNLLSVYTKYVDHLEVEIAYLVIGRGSYAVETVGGVPQIKDDETLLAEIAGAQAAIYGPGTSPNSGSPEIEIGGAIGETLYAAKRVNSVDGQTLRAPNAAQVTGGYYFYGDGTCYNNDSDLRQYFEAGDEVQITGAVDAGYDLDGIYTVLDVPDSENLILDDPASVNGDWATLALDTPDYIVIGSNMAAITGTEGKIAGPFVVELSDDSKLSLNFVAVQGLYKQSDQQQYYEEVDVEVSIQPIDANGDPDGAPETFEGTIEGSASTRDQRAMTLVCDPTFSQRASVTVRRISDTDRAFSGTVVDEVRLRDAYVLTPVTASDFGDVTTVQTVIPATRLALAVKQRKLNMVVTRKLLIWSEGEFGETLTATKRADDILANICVDPHIGNRQPEEVDFAAIHEAIAAVEARFGSASAIEFCWTLDDDRVSFEETLQQIASAVFCLPLRDEDGRVSLLADVPTEDSLMLFNHRNVLPGTLAQSVRFGNSGDHDGVELRWRDGGDGDTDKTYQIPVDGTAVQPKVIDAIGTRNFDQAYWRAWRAWNRIRYSNETVDATVLPHAQLLPVGSRILFADSNRPGSIEGEITDAAGLTVELSQKFQPEEGHTYTIFLQHDDATVEAMAVTGGADAWHAVLDGAPSQALVTAADRVARTAYIIVDDAIDWQVPYLLLGREPVDGMMWALSAVAYRDEYYQNDGDSPA